MLRLLAVVDAVVTDAPRPGAATTPDSSVLALAMEPGMIADPASGRFVYMRSKSGVVAETLVSTVPARL